jgi:hypothetical protein
MKTKDEIEKVLGRVDTASGSQYQAMTYEQGVEEALLWAIGDIPDDEFTYGGA